MCRLVKIYQQDIPGKQAKENIKAGVERHLAKLTASQRQQLLGISGNKSLYQWRKLAEIPKRLVRTWQAGEQFEGNSVAASR